MGIAKWHAPGGNSSPEARVRSGYRKGKCMSTDQVTYVCEALHDHVRRVREYCFHMTDTLQMLTGAKRNRVMRQFIQDATDLIESLRRLYLMAKSVRSLSLINLEQVEAEINRMCTIRNEHIYLLDE